MTITDRAPVPESYYRDKLMGSLEGACAEVKCLYGYVDIVTDEEIIEVKRLPGYKEAIGQLVFYRTQFPDLSPRAHFIVKDERELRFLNSYVRSICFDVNIDVSHEIHKEYVETWYDIGKERFSCEEDLRLRLRAIKEKYFVQMKSRPKLAEPTKYKHYEDVTTPIEGEDLELMLNIVNDTSWANTWFDGKVVEVAVLSKASDFKHASFRVRAEGSNKWKDISAKRYISDAISSKNRFDKVYVA